MPSPVSDPARLAALRSTGLLDSAPEPAFDRLTRLAEQLLGVSITLVSLVDEDRQFFKSARGVDVTGTPLSHSFCRHVVERGTPVVVEDARLDPLVRDNPAVEEYGAIAYAGVPLLDGSGNLLGSVCAVEPHPRAWTAAEVSVLEELSALATAEIRLRSMTDAVERSHAHVSAVVESALDAIVTVDATGRITEYNRAAAAMFGHPRHAAIGARLGELVIPEWRRATFAADLRSGMDERIGVRHEAVFVRASGEEFLAELTITRTDVDGEIAFTGFMRDLSEREHHRRALLEAEQRMALVVDAAPMILFALDAEGVVTLSEGSGLAVLGMEGGQVVGQSVFDLYADNPRILANFRRALAGERFSTLLEVEGTHFDTRYTPLLSATGEHEGTVAVSLDVGETVRAQAEIAHLAFHDQLTGLANRAGLERELTCALARTRAAGRSAALLFIDLDDFKTVNDSLGHAAGDEVLQEAAQRLRGLTRPGDLLSRQGGDEFLIFLDGLGADAAEVAARAARRAISAFERPFLADGLEFQVGTSVGVSVFPGDGDGFDELLRHADVAMYQAKRAGRGRVAFYAADRDDARARLTMTSRLRRALTQGEFSLHYQPVFRLADGRPTGAEALIRWCDPERGNVSPADFIPAAEASGMIVEIGAWVAEAACRQLVEWEAAGLPFGVAFNVSPVQLEQPDFVESLAATLERTGADPSRVVVEITESVAMAAVERTGTVLHAISSLGVSLAIDDFGAGHSSLTRLRHLPATCLKIDRALLEGVPEDRGAIEVVRATLALAQALAIPTVAEGVETEAQRAFLAAEGCTYAQGFGLARPMPADRVTALLTAAAAGALAAA